MRKLILSMQISLDGFIEGPNGDMSWMQTDSAEGWNDVFDMLSHVDLLLLGRVMFPVYRDYWKRALKEPGFSANEIKYAQLAEKTPHLVFSKTMKDPEWENTKIFSGDVVKEVSRLKQMPGKDIYLVGGAKLAATVVDAGLVDEYRLTVNPVIVGSGKSFFNQQHSMQKLKLEKSDTSDFAVVILRYSVVG